MREEIADQIVELERKIAVLPEGSISKKTKKKTIRRQDNHPSADGLSFPIFPLYRSAPRPAPPEHQSS